MRMLAEGLCWFAVEAHVVIFALCVSTRRQQRQQAVQLVIFGRVVQWSATELWRKKAADDRATTPSWEGTERRQKSIQLTHPILWVYVCSSSQERLHALDAAFEHRPVQRRVSILESETGDRGRGVWPGRTLIRLDPAR